MNACPRSSNFPNCKWIVEASPTRPGMYYIKASDRSTYIHAHGGTHAGNKLTMHPCPKADDVANCQWALEASTTRQGMYYIRASDGSTYIHAYGGTRAGHQLTMHACPKGNDYSNCQWSLAVPQQATESKYEAGQSGKYCSDNWQARHGAHTKETLGACELRCDASPSCL